MKHIICILQILNADTMASGYSVDTQGYWNGIIGRVELQWEEICHIGNIQVYPKEEGICIRLTVVNDIVSPLQRKQASIECRVCSEDGRNCFGIRSNMSVSMLGVRRNVLLRQRMT